MHRKNKRSYLKFSLLWIFLFPFTSFAQVRSKGVNDLVLLSKEVNSIPVPRNDKEFIDFLNYKFDQFVKEKTDTILFWYVETEGYGIRNYGLIFTKTGRSSQAFAYDKSSKTIVTFTLNNDTLRNINIYGLYQIFQDDYVRSVDTTVISTHNDVIFCKFYFGNKKILGTGFYNRVFLQLDRNFRHAYINESIRH